MFFCVSETGNGVSRKAYEPGTRGISTVSSLDRLIMGLHRQDGQETSGQNMSSLFMLHQNLDAIWRVGDSSMATRVAEQELRLAFIFNYRK